MAAILRDALLPNLVQTAEGVPAFVHGGPFANIAHGCNSIARHARWLSPAPTTSSPRPASRFDLGGEKFFDIKCRSAGFDPSAIVLVATIRALKMHGGKPLARVAEPDAAALETGLANLEKHVESIRKFEQPCVVAINHFPTDTRGGDRSRSGGSARAMASRRSSRGRSRRAARAAWRSRELVQRWPSRPGSFRPLYDWSAPIEEKIQTIAREMYGAEAVDYAPRARARSRAAREARLRESAGLHRQDAAVALGQSLAARPAEGLPRDGARDPARGGRRVRDPDHGRDPADAGPAARAARVPVRPRTSAARSSSAPRVGRPGQAERCDRAVPRGAGAGDARRGC